jgi:ATP-binding cassette subfamily B protein
LQTTLFKFLLSAIKPQLLWFLCIVILPFAWALDQIVFPYCIKIIVNTVADYNDERENIYSYISPIIVVGLSTWIFLILVWRFLDIVDINFIPRFQANIRLKMFEYIERHSHRFFIDEFSGNLANKISNMAESCWQIIFFFFRCLLPVTISILITIIIVGTVSLQFSIITLIFYLLHMFICIIVANKCDVLSSSHSEAKNILQGSLVDSLSNIVNITIFSGYQYEINRLNIIQKQEIISHKKLLKSLFYIRFILDIPSLIMMMFIIYFLIEKWQQGIITPGDFAFIITLSFNNMLSVWRIGFIIPNFFRDVGVCKQSLKLLNIPHEVKDIPNASSIKVTKGEIIFNRVDFYYAEDKKLFLDKNVYIDGGEKIGLVGHSGSGKSTFVNLILRHYDVIKGEILIDNQDISKVAQSSLRNVISIVPQDTMLFHRTIMDNIRYGRLDASDQEVIEASKQAHCHEFISELEFGYDTIVGERGIRLSGGERQRIAIARAILKNAPILILDEATSALDSITEKYIQASLKVLMKDKTTIIIAHRLSTLLRLDRIFVFHDGKIIEKGSHNNLLSRNGHYAKLWSIQADEVV